MSMIPPQHIINAMLAATEGCQELPRRGQNDRRGIRRRPRVAFLPVALATFATVSQISKADQNCPPTHSGWAPSQDCKSYHWCTNGILASLSYDCDAGLLFDSAQLTCIPAESVNCGAFWQHFVTEMAAPLPPSSSAFTQPTLPTPMPSPRPSMIGEAIYYADFPSVSCRSDVASRPSWMASEHMFTTKKECCEVMMDWIPLEQCLGADFVETNYIFEPTTYPTVKPSEAPSLAPSFVSTEVPSISPIETASYAPSVAASLSHENNLLAANEIQTNTEAVVSTLSLGIESDSYLMEIFAWANNEIDPISWQIVNQRSLEEETSITELLLPVVADATISRLRSDVNFEMQSALAVDGATYEKYDSLLKFDISLLEKERPVESATLKMHAVLGCASGGLFSTILGQDWESDTVTWNSAPKTDGQPIATLGQVAQGEIISVELTPALSLHEASSDKYLTIRIESNEESRCMYSSMEGVESEAPTLEIKYRQVVAAATTSEGSRKESPLTISHGDFLEISAADDATVVAIQSEQNFGQEPNLLAAFDSNKRNFIDILIRFDLNHIQGILPRSAVLSLFAETDCSSAGTFTTTSVNPMWTENSVTWSNAPVYDSRAVGGTMIGTFGKLEADHWYGFNVHKALIKVMETGSDTVTFRVSAGESHPCQYSSRNGGLSPKLMLAF